MQLAELAAVRADGRTGLEAQAYALWMAGSLAFEREQWEAALTKLCRARCGVPSCSLCQCMHVHAAAWVGVLLFIGCRMRRQVYQELARLGSMEQQALLNKQLDELQGPITFCRCCALMSSAQALCI
jgi:hypothetical protein